MKTIKKMITSVLAVALLLGLPASNVWAAEKEAYSYTVTFYAGNQGDFSGAGGLSISKSGAAHDVGTTVNGDEIIVTGLKAGDVVAFNAGSSVALEQGSKYYVQGVRLSGRDNNEVAASAFVVNKDADYVVAYGIRGNQTSYTVKYETEAGEVLAESDVFYGNVGDKPVVAYKYIEGYAPKAFGMTKTLSENAAENVFTFVYEKMPEPTIENIVETVPGSDSESDDDNNEIWGVVEPTPGTPGGSDVTDESEDATEDESQSTGETEQIIVDLDDEDTPLTNIDLDDAEKSFPLFGSIAIGIIAIIALVDLIFILRRRKR